MVRLDQWSDPPAPSAQQPGDNARAEVLTKMQTDLTALGQQVATLRGEVEGLVSDLERSGLTELRDDAQRLQLQRNAVEQGVTAALLQLMQLLVAEE